MGSVDLAISFFFRRFPRLRFVVACLPGFRITKAVYEAQVVRTNVLKDFGSFPIIRAVWTRGRLNNIARESSGILGYREFQDVALSPNRRGGFILDGSRLLLPEAGLPGVPKVFYPNTDVSGVLAQSSDSVLLKKKRTTLSLESGIFVGSIAPHNWFHWLIDTLATAYFARYLHSRFDSFPLLLPSAGLEKENWRVALQLTVGDRPMLPVGSEEVVRVRQLVRIQGVTRPNPRLLQGHAEPRVSVLSAPILEYRDHLLSALRLEDASVVPGLKFFIARNQAEVRRYNQDDLIEDSQRFGFRPIFLEDLTFAESVKVFREAEAVIGPHGAGWANLLFSSSTTKALFWTWGGVAEDNWYQNVAFLSSVRFLQLPQRALRLEGGDPRVANYTVSRKIFQEYLAKL